MVSLDYENILKSRVLWIGVAAVVGLMLLGWLLSSVDSCRFESKQDKLRSNVNSLVANIKEREGVIANLKLEQEREKEQVVQQTREYNESVNRTDAAREQTNEALRRLEQPRNGNGNVSVEELERLLNDLP